MKYLPATATLLFALLLAAILLAVRLTPPAPQQPEKKADISLAQIEEELFIEPELVVLGEQTATANDQPAPSIKGEPQPTPVEIPEVKVPVKEQPKPETPPAPKTLAREKESPVKVPEENGNAKEAQAASSAVANKFASKNGNPSGNETKAAGSGGSGIGISGSAQGRTFRSCPKPDVTLRHKTIVTVAVTIDAEGRVVEASASGSADASIRRACERAARQARWSEKKGAATTRGTLTFTIIPA